MITYAKAQVQGNLGTFEIKDLDDGRKMARFSVAAEESYKSGGEWKKTPTTWINAVTFNPATVEYIGRNFRKGDVVSVEGRLRENKWKDDNGKDQSRIELHADNVEIDYELRKCRAGKAEGNPSDKSGAE